MGVRCGGVVCVGEVCMGVGCTCMGEWTPTMSQITYGRIEILRLINLHRRVIPILVIVV